MASSSASGKTQIGVGNAFDGFVPQASESSATLRKKLPCNVFINHRGCDVKHTLASTIYHTLDLVGVRAFLDEESLDLGDSIPTEIQEAMSSAAVYIAIFSVNYAQSPWCLGELSFMLKTGTTIIPVFYYVKPDDLRRVAQGKGVYADAFSQHKKKHRYSSETLREWETALQSVSYLSGFMWNKDNVDEGSMLKSIVNSVLKEIEEVSLKRAKFPDAVGMDEPRETVIEMLDMKEKSTRAVVIYGTGGIGKTTLATAVYNGLPRNVYKLCRVDMDQNCSVQDIRRLQEQILKDLFGGKIKLSSCATNSIYNNSRNCVHITTF